uniref:uncharacterized protein LOC122579732 n=1 Tax=Erigeron canadensis TaxID=72917 RepID=UPI001CB96A23|nr:uncharacterized protein LOC122579732 [Erigeron canadensis]
MLDGASSYAVVPGTPRVLVVANSIPSVPNSSKEEPMEASGNESRPINLVSSSSESGNEHVSIHVQPPLSLVAPYQRRTTEGARLPYTPRDPNAPGPSAPVQDNLGFGPSFFLGDPYAAGPSRVPVYNPNLVMPVATEAHRSEYALRQMSRMNNSLIRTREAIENQAQGLTGAYQHASDAMTVAREEKESASDAMTVAREGKETIWTAIWILSVLVVLVIVTNVVLDSLTMCIFD